MTETREPKPSQPNTTSSTAAAGDLWPHILELVKQQVNLDAYAGWLDDTRQRSGPVNGALHVCVPNSLAKAWLENQVGAQISQAMQSLGCPIPVVFEVVPPPSPAVAVRSGCPPIPKAAWHKWIRQYRDAVSPCVESSDNFHYAGFLMAAGAGFGKLIYTKMGERIFPNLYIAIVGRSGRGKGGATHYPLRLIHETSPVVTPMYSVDSAEGLLSFIERKIGTDERRRQSTLVIQLDELRSLIEKSSMKGLGGIIPLLCRGYDSPDELENNTKTSFLSVRPPCISVYASTTFSALNDLHPKDVEGGLGNRFMWVPGVRKTVPIPDPPEPDPVLWSSLVARMKEAFAFWMERKQSRIGFSPEARKMYDAYYHKMFFRSPDDLLIETLSDRHRMHVRKTALIFAGLDMSEFILPDHMDAAIEFTEFLYDSLEYVFRGYNLSSYAKEEQRIVETVLSQPDQQIFRRELQRRFRIDGETFQRRLRAVAGYPDDANWDGPLRQSTSGRGRVLVAVNIIGQEEAKGVPESDAKSGRNYGTSQQGRSPAAARGEPGKYTEVEKRATRSGD